MTPSDLYYSAISYPAIYFPILFSHSVNFILLFIINIFDFFLLIFIRFFSAQSSQILIVFFNLLIFYPNTFVSSAKIYGDISPSFRNSSVRSLVNILKRRQEMLHPYPNPLPIGILSCFVGIVKLLNISLTPWMTSSFMSRSSIFLNRSYWFTISYALAKSINSIHVLFSSWSFAS